MPQPMVHLGVAKNILDSGFEITSLPQYYLGVISPDAIHMRENSSRDDKDRVHLKPMGKAWRDVDVHAYYEFLLDCVETSKNKANIDFLWGYVIHILTDMYWVPTLYDAFNKKYKEDSSPIQDRIGAYYSDCDILDHVLFKECDWRNSVWQSLEFAKCTDFLDLLSAAEIDLWNKRTLRWYDSGKSQHINPVKYISKIDLYDFIFECSKFIFQNICQIK